jgi:dipeptidyl aminopeptidase/acylaminoacyl peptidase
VSAGSTPFHDLSDFVAIPRVAALRLAPDGTWLAAAVQTLSADKKKYLTSIWRIDTQGGPARRLTRSAEGEGSPRFLPDGSLLFISKRPDPGRKKTGPDGDSGSGDDVPALWLLAAAGGEARTVAALPGGVTAAEVAKDAGGIVVSSPVLPAAGGQGGRSPVASTAVKGSSAEDDARLRQERKDAGITAILHESAPVRYWDHDLGPDQPRLFAVDPDQVQETDIGWAGGDKELSVVADEGGEDQGHEGTERAAKPARLRDLTPEPGRALDGEAFELTPDGTSVVTGWWQWDPAGESHCELVMIDVASGKRRVLLSVPEFDFSGPRVSPDGRFIVCQREQHATAERPIKETLRLERGRPGGPGPAARLRPVAGRTGLVARFPRAVLRRRRRRQAAGVPRGYGNRRGHPRDQRRRRVHRPEPGAGRPVPVRAAGDGGLTAHPGPHRPDHRSRARRAGLPGGAAYGARAAGGGAGDRR